MNKDKFFEELENYLKEIEGKQLPETLKVTVLYSTGDEDVFNVSIAFRANMMVATKNRKKYLYHKNRLISLDHVVKMEFEEIGSEQHESK